MYIRNGATLKDCVLDKIKTGITELHLKLFKKRKLLFTEKLTIKYVSKRT